ncbi:MAG: TetR/AcrR family transcriptional regulator [Methanobrevibacter sp.]|nr:TetR/AcrR family transcriptional regulator [Methanobrevibacter sp.]
MSIIKRREKERKQRRKDIINAAEKLFFSKGFDIISMNDIASEVELSKATLYLYFENKESLFFAIVLRGTRILNSMIKNDVEKEKTGIDKINAFRDAYNKFTQEYPDHIKIYNYFHSGRFHLTEKKIVEKEKNVEFGNPDNSKPYLSECANEILKLREERFSILCNSVKKGINDKTIRQDIDPVEISVLLLSISKNLSTIPLDRKISLKNRGIDQKTYFKHVSKLIQDMIINQDSEN